MYCPWTRQFKIHITRNIQVYVCSASFSSQVPRPLLISQLGNLTNPSPTEYHNRIMMSRLLIHGKEYSHYFHAFIFVFVSFFSQDKYERHTHCTDYDVVPGPEHDPSTWSPLTQLTDELNVTQCIDPQRFLICVFINQEKHALTYKGLFYQKTHSMSSL